MSAPITRLLFFFCLVNQLLAATTNNWTNAVSGLWTAPTNWSGTQAPNSSFTFILITNAGSKTVTLAAGTPATNLTISRLTLSAPSGSTNTLALVNVGTNLPLQVSSALTVDRSCVIALTNSALNSAGATLDHAASLNLTNSMLTQSGFTFFDMVNGYVWLESGLIDCGPIVALRVGRNNTNASTLTVHGGTVLAPEIQIATSTSGQGNLAVSGGIVIASNLVTIGYGVNSTGLVSVTAGQLIATNNISYVGKSGYGQMTISGGGATCAFLSVGNNANGLLTLSSGQLTMRPNTTNDWMQVGNIGAGQFNMSGGTALLYGEFHVGDDSSGLNTGMGTASITGGQLIATNDTTAIGRYGPGQMTVSNAIVTLTNVSVGRHDGSVGTLMVQSNAQVFLLDALSIGRFSNSVGHVFVSGGLLSLTNDNIFVGREGAGDLTISNGTVQALAALVAVSTVSTDSVTMLPVTNLPSGTLTIAGGSLVLTSNLLVGGSSVSTGQVSMVGGNLNVGGGPTPGYIAVANGSFTLSQGSITTDNLILNNGGGSFTFRGGTIQAKGITVSNGAPFVVGDGLHAATLQLQGGTYSFANGLVISNNATVTGCGSILGTINNFGTLATNCAPSGVVITSLAKTGTTATVFFTTLANSNHVLEYKNSLNSTSWSAILPGILGTGSATNKADTNATANSRIYRIHLQ